MPLMAKKSTQMFFLTSTLLSGNPTWFQLNKWWTNAVVSSMGFPWMSLTKYSTSIIWSAWPGAWWTLCWIFSPLILVTSVHLVLMDPSGLGAGTGYLSPHFNYGNPMVVWMLHAMKSMDYLP